MRFFRDERGQDAFEYLLVLGAVVVAIVISFAAFDAVVFDVSGTACESVDTAASTEAGDCINTEP